MFDRAAGLLALAFRFFLGGSLGHLHIVRNVLDDGGGVIPKNPSRQRCARAESFRKLLPFVDYLVDVGSDEFRKTHPSSLAKARRPGFPSWILISTSHQYQPIRKRGGKTEWPFLCKVDPVLVHGVSSAAARRAAGDRASQAEDRYDMMKRPAPQRIATTPGTRRQCASLVRVGPSVLWSPLLDGRHETPSRRHAGPGRLVSDGAAAAAPQHSCRPQGHRRSSAGMEDVRSFPTQKKCEAHRA